MLGSVKIFANKKAVAWLYSDTAGGLMAGSIDKKGQILLVPDIEVNTWFYFYDVKFL